MERKILIDIFNAGLAAADAFAAVRRAVHVHGSFLTAGGDVYDLDSFNRVLVLGAGKAGARMALALEELLDGRIDSGLIIVKYGHAGPLERIEQAEAAHPLPDAAGTAGTKRIADLAAAADERTLIICLLSGGASSLLVLPRPGITLEDKRNATELLLKAGASIHELNAVRKHLSGVKGGKLAESAYPAKVLSMALSDVIGDPFDVIASGPTAPDPTTFADAAAVIEKYRLRSRLPGRVSAFIDQGIKGIERETAKPGDRCFKKTTNIIVGSNSLALAAARTKAQSYGFSSEIITTGLQGEARDAARMLSEMAIRTRNAMASGERRCLLFGGETTVTVRGRGTGGRNQELALAFARKIQGIPGIALLSAGTDGTDGPTDAAGAVVDGETARRALREGIEPRDYLDRNDSYSFFKQLDSATSGKSQIVTGPTGTNVMDLQVICIEKRE